MKYFKNISRKDAERLLRQGKWIMTEFIPRPNLYQTWEYEYEETIFFWQEKEEEASEILETKKTPRGFFIIDSLFKFYGWKQFVSDNKLEERYIAMT